MQRISVGLDRLLQQVEDEIREAELRLAELQGQKAGILRAVRFSQEQAVQHVGPPAPLMPEVTEEQLQAGMAAIGANGLGG